ncbi:methyltransferase domain-containing protein [Cellulophaga sp. Z1A5H]|uniref:methyltransferase domain-containing protein n=1 Tax=Cellulophaga sp. Z1A5H TaxID=2687291 RepID=UPI0013FE15F5|nr:methyltransferase domain-containing protein [Cellulophaga sp. Z1A5H]
MLINLSERSNQPELMDSFEEPIGSLELVFQDINSVNSLLGGNNITMKAILQLMDTQKKEQYTIVDMGCGDGNMLREVALYFRKHKLKASFIGIDLNEIALEIAQKNAKEFPEIRFLYKDILTLKEEDLKCDILINTLTMHHFTDDQVLIFLNKFTKLAQIGVVINDLQRSRWAYYLFHLFSAIFIKTRIAKIDGLISIQRAFIKKELKSYAKKLPNVSHDIQWKWAFRYLWVMKPIKK